jgi:GWxTD domain-containing protein
LRAFVLLLLGALIAGCAEESFELNLAMREGRPYETHYPHPVFPVDSSATDSLGSQRRAIWNEYEALLDTTELSALGALGDTLALAAWTEEFWRRRDPLITTELNERREEHRRRLALALREYPSPAPPYYDARGRALIQMGEPDGRIATEADISTGGYTPPLEIWRVDDLLVAFQSFANSGVFSPSGMPLEQEQLFTALAGGVRETFVMLENYEVAVDSGRVERYRFRQAGPPLGTALSADRYRAPGGGGLLRLYYAQDGRRLSTAPDSSGGPGHWRIQESVALEPAGGDELPRTSSREFHLRPPDWPGAPLITGLLERKLLPGEYELTFHLLDLVGPGESILRRRLLMPDFRADSLALSDISLFSFRSTADGPPRPDLPRPSGRYRRGEKLALRCEIYGLRPGPGRRGRFTLSYAIEGRGRSGASASFGQSVDGESGQVELVLDTGELDPGDYQLAITIIDEERRLRAILPDTARAESRRGFSILERREKP